ncbi:MAG: cobaltochelatase subunit CobN [Methanobacterium sp. PtaU1.Bin097]|jgi:cobaltochelatase CobN|nr:MAG: cobaltochelatase subunit CobN [Methanobacterium sp. PtaU1.Bin097]
MKKQVILLATTLIFALMLCGAVTAADPLEKTNQSIDPEITLNVTLEHPEALSGNKLPKVSVKDANGNVINQVTVTKAGNTQYKVNFISTKTNFNLTVGALGHVSKTVNVLVSQINPNDPVLYGKANVSLRAYNLLILSGSPNFSPTFVNSNQNLRDEGYYFNLGHFTNTEITSGDTNIENRVRQLAAKADVIVIQMISEPNTVAKLKELIAGNNAKIFAIRCGVAFLNDPKIDSNDNELKGYWENSGEDNIARFQLKVLKNVGMAVNSSKDLSVVIYPTEFIYHPDSGVPMFSNWNDYKNWYIQSGHYKANTPWVGIIGYNTMFLNGNGAMLEEILRSLEEKGLNAILAITNGNLGRVNAINNFFMNGNNTRISALVACVGYTMVYSSSDATFLNQSIEALKKLNVPVFAPIYASDLDDWEQNSAGVSSEIYWQVAFPEMEGRIEPIMLGGVVSAEKDPYTGISVQRYTPLPERIERVTSRVLNWTKLQTLPNKEKKIALIYYNLQGGKDGVGASYLNVPESISEILKALKKDGYNVPGNYSVDKIVSLLLTVGNNVGSWAPGELKKVIDAGAITIPLNEYMKWFNTLPEELQQKVIAKWGPAPGNVMVYQGKIVIPGIMLGNIFLGAQPMRGWGEDPTQIAHSATLPPTHQYIAFYMWLQNKMKANAVIHLGTHGTLEWLPGRTVGMGEDDWPDILIGNIPHIYPYIIDNTGEGTQAKRRGYAVIIDHLTAPIVASGLYGDLATLQDLINSYDNTQDSQRKEILKREILDLVVKLHLDDDLNLNLKTQPFDDIMHAVEHGLEDMASTLIPYGLHTFGVALSGDALDQMVESIVSFDRGTRDNPAYREYIRNLLSQNYEIANLLSALRGEYISPSLGGDPIRKGEDVLPTGSNFYSFDPRSVPDAAAWEIGKKMADDMLKAFYKENGHYPETVGVVLWSTETMRTNGQTIAMILRYLGLEPELKNGRFVGVKVTSLADLGRPRVDVLVTISGLFRDTFSYTIDLLDQAFRQVAGLSENTSDNYIKKHYQKDLNKYTQSGMNSTDAETLAGARIFGPPPEAYGTGVGQLVPSTTGWDDQSDLVDTYLSRMSYIYGSGIYGISGLEAFKNQLSNVEATIMVRDNNYGLLDNDDVFQFLGGLSMAAKSLSNKDVSVYIANTRGNPKIETLNQFMSNEIRTRILNPKWIEGMLKEGFSGANEISHEIGHLFAWNAVTPNAVSDWTWQLIAETYILDPKVSSQFMQANPYAYASTAAWALEAVRRGMWNPDVATLTKIIDQYIETTIKYGVTCCHHTCANIDFNQFLVMGSSLSREQLQQYADAYEGATGKTLEIPGNPGEQPEPNPGTVTPGTDVPGGENNEQSTNPNQGTTSPGEASTVQAASTEAGQASDSGSENAHEISEVSQQNSSQSNTPLVAIIGVILLLCLVGVGYFRNDIRNLIKK